MPITVLRIASCMWTTHPLSIDVLAVIVHSDISLLQGLVNLLLGQLLDLNNLLSLGLLLLLAQLLGKVSPLASRLVTPGDGLGSGILLHVNAVVAGAGFGNVGGGGGGGEVIVAVLVILSQYGRFESPESQRMVQYECKFLFQSLVY